MARRLMPESSSSNSDSESSEDSVKLITIIVENLSPNVTQDHIHEIFAYFGRIHSCGLRNLKHYAIVNYTSREEAESAISCMHEAQIDGLTVRVKFETNPQISEEELPKSRSKSQQRKQPRSSPQRQATASVPGKHSKHITRPSKESKPKERQREQTRRHRSRERPSHLHKSEKKKQNVKRRRSSSSSSSDSRGSSKSSSSSSSNSS